MHDQFQGLLAQIEKDIFLSKEVRTDNLKSVCLTLGPYRNLTTLTAAIISLHPGCQVLNHAGMRILGIKELDFLSEYNDNIFANFVKYAVHISGSGTRAEYGGTITLSHAFDHNNMKKRYFERYANVLIKEKIECLYWKESLRLSNYIKQTNVDLGNIFKRNDKLLFLMPIRNPLDCAESNRRTGHMLLFPDMNQDASFEDVLDKILIEFLWFFRLRDKYPERFFYFYENKVDENLWLELATFLRINPTKEWIRDASNNYQIKKTYKHSNESISYYRNKIEEYFSEYSDVIDNLSSFAE